MALLTCDFFSDVLGMGSSMTVILPQPSEEQIGVRAGVADGPPAVLYLLHGLSDDHTAWSRYTSISRYAETAGLAVVMPSVHRSFYADEAYGHRYWSFIADELPSVVRTFLRVTDDPSQTFVAGLSMGGYGAMKLALSRPERFGAAASLSGALDLSRLAGRPDLDRLYHLVFDRHPGPDDDLLGLLRSARGVPPLYVGCGTDDVLISNNRRFAKAARAAGAEVRTNFRRGDHEWALWDTMIADVIDWLPLPSRRTEDEPGEAGSGRRGLGPKAAT